MFVTPWTITPQAPLSMEFSGQEYWSGLPFPSQENLSDPGIESGSPALWADSLPSELPGKPRNPFQVVLFQDLLACIISYLLEAICLDSCNKMLTGNLPPVLKTVINNSN